MKRPATKREPAAARAAATGIVAKTSKATQAALAKIGIHRDFDLVLHLPLRYEDQTHLYRIAEAPNGQTVLVEGVVTDCAIKFRPKRQLVCSVEDDSGTVVMRFLNFYGSQDRKSTRLNSSHIPLSRMPSSA